MKTFFVNSPVQLTRCRQLLNQIFDYAEDETYIRPNQNPVLNKFQWETGNKRKISDKTFAKTITKNFIISSRKAALIKDMKKLLDSVPRFNVSAKPSAAMINIPRGKVVPIPNKNVTKTTLGGSGKLSLL